MPEFNRLKDDLKTQYSDSSNLEARIRLHRDFSTNKYDFYRWVFDHYTLPSGAEILEVGCGSGQFWVSNREVVPSSWQLFLSDYSAGMLADARRKLGQETSRIRFLQVDVQNIPFADQTFDAVCAHHMLYHVPNLPRALQEIRRVLKPGGVLYSATNGLNHNKEMTELLSEMFADYKATLSLQYQWVGRAFTLDTAADDHLSQVFSEVRMDRYLDSYHVTEVEPLVDYLMSMRLAGDASQATVDRVRQIIQQKIESDGAIDIQKDTGMFICHK